MFSDPICIESTMNVREGSLFKGWLSREGSIVPPEWPAIGATSESKVELMLL